jgi:vacuolar-type H+-ATPase subunit H
MNPNPSVGRDVVELWGREFNLVKNGLSEAQVVSFVNDLTKQHDTLLQRQDHLTALNTLAERTVIEAEKLAAEIREDARRLAAGDAAKIIAQAEASAESQTNAVMAEAMARAEKLAREKEDQALASADKIVNELKKSAEAEAKRIIGGAESRGRHLIEQNEAEASKQAAAILVRAQQEASHILDREKQRIQPEISQFVGRLQTQLMAELDGLKSKVGELEPRFHAAPAGRGAQTPPPQTQKSPAAQTSDEFMELMAGADAAEAGEPKWEVEIVPPIDIMKIMNIVSQLDSLPEVSRTEIIPRNDRTSITVYADNAVELVASLRTMPEVLHAEETTSKEDNPAGPRKVSIALSTKSGLTATPAAVEDVLTDGLK